MAITTANAGLADFGDFSRLRLSAKNNDPEALRAAAKQFESLFTQMMLKSARDAKVGDDLLGSEQGSFYQDMFDQRMAQHLSAGKGLGIAELLIRQLQGAQVQPPTNSAFAAPANAPPATGMSLSKPLVGIPQTANENDLKPQTETKVPVSATPVAVGNVPSETPRRNPLTSLLQKAGDKYEEFTRSLMPYAEKAAAALGVPAKVIMAQAALETGWGRHQMRKADGSPSHNLFGIKADAGWNGDRLRKATHEYEAGQKQTQSAEFRSYDSLEAAFKDYVQFLKSNPRYTAALNGDGSGAHFAQGLQKAGYATDPSYAQKLLSIADGGRLQLASAKSGRRIA